MKKKKFSEKSKKDLFTFISDLKEELKKVSWTTKPELLSATKVVILSTFAFGMGIYFADLMIKGLLDVIKASVRFVFG